MKASIKIIVTVEIEVEDQAALDDAMTELGGRVYMMIDDTRLGDGRLIDWDFNTDYTVNYGTGVSLVSKEG